QASGQQVSGQPTAPAATRPAEQPAAPAAKPASPPKRGGTLRIGQQFDIQLPRPHAITFQHYSVVYSVFDTLVRLDPNNKPRPELAQSWEFSKDFTTLTMKLQPGVKFHTGRDFTAKDVVWNLERVRDPKASSQNLTMAKSIARMETPDPQTLVLTFEAPRPAVFDMLDALWILDPESLADADNGQRWVGTGPFRWESWAPGDRLELKRFDGYWKAGLPYLDAISMRVIADPQALVTQLQAGGLDLIVNPAFEQVGELRQDKMLAVLESDTGAQMYYVGLNTSTPPLDKKEVRQAINYAIDRKRVVSAALSGIGEAFAIPWSKSSLAYDAARQNAFPLDVAKAKALLTQAGVADGIDLPFVTSQALPGLSKMAQVIQSDLAKANIRVKIEEVEAAVLTTNLTGRKFTHAWNLGFGFNNLHPSTMPSVAFPWRVGLNSSYYESPEYADLVAKAQVTTDPAQAKDVFARLTDHILDASFVLPVTPQKRMWATRADVRDVNWGQEDALFLERSWLDR
ncbi:MAG: ABC transporter substrate-binding protein, partial [Chloroflexi bacterium]|nr:ABC transporter substrate-binding protein [Chloroflexota bacterium]